MKIIHCADLHLDSKMTANLSKEQAKERKMEILRTFSRMVEYAKNNQVSVIIIAGDLFDTRTVSATARNLVRDVIIQNSDIDFIYLKGNHDYDSFLSKLEEIPENLKLFNEEWTSYRYGSIVITGMELSPNNQAAAYNSLVLSHDDYNIVTLHGQITDYGTKDDAEIINLDGLKNKNIDYLALGHVHERRLDTIDNRGIYCYSGCLEGRGFDECGEKGFMLLDIDDKTHEAEVTFVPMAYRNLYTMPVDVTGARTTQEAATRIEQEIGRQKFSSSSLVKFVLVGQIDVESEINCDFLKDMFEDYFYFEKVYDETKLLINYSDYEKDASLKGEFIRMVLGSDMDEEKKSEVIKAGIMALSGEEI